jgi:hypothetical protein
MFAQLTSPVSSLKEYMKLATYQTLYSNLMARFCNTVENLDYDFFTSFHEDTSQYLQHYNTFPTLYNCKGSVGFQGFYNVGNSYFVIAGRDYVMVFLEPEAAVARNLPFISILEGNYFRPYMGCHLELWQNQIEQYKPYECDTLQRSAMSLSGF